MSRQNWIDIALLATTHEEEFEVVSHLRVLGTFGFIGATLDEFRLAFQIAFSRSIDVNMLSRMIDDRLVIRFNDLHNERFRVANEDYFDNDLEVLRVSF